MLTTRGRHFLWQNLIELWFRGLRRVWPLLRDSASLVEVTVTQACPTLFILNDPFWDMQGPLSPC